MVRDEIVTQAEKAIRLRPSTLEQRINGSVGAVPEYGPGANVSTGPWPDLSDERGLVERAARQDAEAFRSLIDRHIAAVVAVARRMLGDEAEAEDVAQEAFMRLWRAGESLEIGALGVRPWLRRVAVNLCLDRTRGAKRLVVTDEPPEVADAPTQERALAEQDLESRVRSAIATLPERQRQALMLFQFEGMSQIEIARAMDVTEEAVESLLSRARRTLKMALKDEWRGLLESSGEP